MAVDTFNPGAVPQTLSSADLSLLLRAAQTGAEPPFGLSDHEVVRLARLVRQDGADWEAATEGLESEALESLIRLLVLAEHQLAGWESGAKSPVIVLAAALKQRKDYPDSLTPWIKAHTGNRFLPYGSLLDRL